MLKEERLNTIVSLVDKSGTVKVQEIMDRLQVSDMTVRRDLTELEKQGKLKRVHGGAQSINIYRHEELSHEQKKIIHQDEKKQLAELTLPLIEQDDTIFLGPGTTIELLAASLPDFPLRVVTNSLPVFSILEPRENIMLYLIGGELRRKTGAFYGEMANTVLQDIRFGKAFIGANALSENRVMTATIEEGRTQEIALNNSFEKYLLLDGSKIGKEDFYSFYHVSDLTALITNTAENGELNAFEDLVRIIK
ncbi:lactose phosphotransferase system repressor [Listeria floridensis FSL S10-1187]|uniref:Lactose phosphotransferase system repressor n=1 Tax=Listeria floridensis FSL S10-1187 TaxID=1265817 RepID=A0ABN0RET0_9LIST|nr:DeoR/GlpR family DNA-binding transcription regulator [Listeria floridensis]EUJ31372.1 lactose phosphotransferase system repressor [Listeria floridensis FSL S10-1187]